eukprot:scaffold51862_cov45-Phaeocystis_antarctica.AAC.2
MKQGAPGQGSGLAGGAPLRCSRAGEPAWPGTRATERKAEYEDTSSRGAPAAAAAPPQRHTHSVEVGRLGRPEGYVTHRKRRFATEPQRHSRLRLRLGLRLRPHH